MVRKSLSIGFGAIVLAGAMSLLSVAPASALTNKECSQQWEAAKAAGNNPGTYKTYKAANCAADAAAPAAAPAPTQAPAAAAPAPTQAPVAAKPAPTLAPAAAPVAKTAPTMANGFATEALAKGHCPGAPVVWMNTKSKVFHDSTSPKYGATKHGAYMCQADATADGGHAAKNEK